MKNLTFLLATILTLSAWSATSFTIINEVEIVKIKADSVNTIYIASNQIYEVELSLDRPRLLFANSLQDGQEEGCAIRYISSAGNYNFTQKINNKAVCDHIELSLKQAMKSDKCPLSFFINVNKEEVRNVEATCDYRASLDDVNYL